MLIFDKAWLGDKMMATVNSLDLIIMKKLKLKKFAGIDDCLGGACPTVYISQDGKFFIQGYVVSEMVKNSIKVPQGESLVEIPEELLRNAAMRLMAQSK